MLENLDKYDFTVLVRTLKISRSGFYAWRKRPESQRSKENREITKQVFNIHQASRKTYGSYRVQAKLKEIGFEVCRSRVSRLMRNAGLRGKSPRKYKVTTNSKHNHLVTKNILNRNFDALKPNQKWVTDITYLPTNEGWLYLAVVMDLFSRRIVGWALDNTVGTSLVLQALIMAKNNRKDSAGVLHHSDRGVQRAGPIGAA